MSQNSFLYVCACKNQNAPVTNSGHTANQSILQFDWLIVMPDLAHSNIEPQFLLFPEICVQKPKRFSNLSKKSCNLTDSTPQICLTGTSRSSLRFFLSLMYLCVQKITYCSSKHPVVWLADYHAYVHPKVDLISSFPARLHLRIKSNWSKH